MLQKIILRKAEAVFGEGVVLGKFIDVSTVHLLAFNELGEYFETGTVPGDRITIA